MRAAPVLLLLVSLVAAGCAAPEQAIEEGAEAPGTFVACPVALIEARWRGVSGSLDALRAPMEEGGYRWVAEEEQPWTFIPGLSESNVGDVALKGEELHLRVFETAEGAYMEGPDSVAPDVAAIVNATYAGASLQSWQPQVLDDVCA